MSDIDISEAIEQGRDSRLNAIVATMVALTATFMALCNVKDGNIGQGMAQAQAEKYQKTYDDLNLHDDQFDLSDAALSVSIALFGVTALTKKRWLLGVAFAFMLFGVFFGVAGFAGWSVHPSALMSWLS